jgi:hypothetical protein
MAVTLGSAALSEATLQTLEQYIEARRTDFCWSSNLKLWDASLVQSSAAVLTHRIEGDFQAQLLAELHARGALPLVPRSVVLLYSIWLPGSYITWHSDYLDKHSLSVYVHRHWDPNHGVAFCWQAWGGSLERHDWRAPPQLCKMVQPTPNSWVHMDDADWHPVSMTTPNAPPRLSLQLFYERR